MLVKDTECPDKSALKSSVITVAAGGSSFQNQQEDFWGNWGPLRFSQAAFVCHGKELQVTLNHTPSVRYDQFIPKKQEGSKCCSKSKIEKAKQTDKKNPNQPPKKPTSPRANKQKAQMNKPNPQENPKTKLN